MIDNRCSSVTLLLVIATFVPGNRQGRCDESPSISIAEITREAPVDFEREILPILRRNCLACHNNTDAESDLILESPQAILKGGASGEVIDTSNSAESLLLKAAAFDAEPFMPPEDNDVGAERLDSQQLGLIKLWIDQGAKGTVKGERGFEWQPLPDGVAPVYAVALSPDGQFVAAGRANQIFLYHVPTKREVGRLTDPELIESGVYDKPGVAHLDLVQSLRFSPDSQLLASGGFRTVKLWRRVQASKLRIEDLANGLSALAVSADGKLVAIGQESGDIVLLAGTSLTTLPAHAAAVTDLHFSAQGLISGGRDKTVRLWNLAENSLAGTLATPTPVLSLAVLANQRFAVAGEDGRIRIWEFSAFRNDSAEPSHPATHPATELAGHDGPVTSLGVSSSQPNRLISGSQDGTLRVWDLSSEKQLLLMKHGDPIEAVAARPDGKRFASAGKNKEAILWDANGKRIAQLKGDFRKQIEVEDAERAVAIAKRRTENANADLKEVEDRKQAESKNAKSAAEARVKAEEDLHQKEETAETLLAKKSAADQSLQQAKAELANVEQRQKEAVAAVARADQSLADARAALEAATKAMAAANDTLTAVRATQDEVDQELQTATAGVKQAEEALKKATAPADKAAGERDAAKQALESATRTMARSEQAVMKVAALIPPAKETVQQNEQHVQRQEEFLEDAKRQLAASEQPYLGIAFSPDGRTLATGGDDRSVRIWDSESGAAIQSCDPQRGRICDLVYTHSGDVLAATVEGQVSLWDPNPEWQLVRRIGSVDSPDVLVDRVTALAFSPDGKSLATGGGEPSRSGELKIWSLADGKLSREIQDAHSDTIQSLEFAPDGKLIASSGADRFAKVFEMEEGVLVRAFEGHTHHVLGVSWRADGRLLATSGADNVIKIWNAKTGDQTRTISGFGKEVTAIHFLAATDHVVASSGDKSVRVKNAANGKQIRSLGGATDFLHSVTASANGKLIAAGGQDSVVRVWQADGKTVVQFKP